MIAVYANCTVSDSNIKQFVALAETLIAETRKESGNVSYELIRGIENPNLFAFLEKWSNQAVLDEHMKTPHFTSIVPKLGELMDAGMNISAHEVIV